MAFIKAFPVYRLLDYIVTKVNEKKTKALKLTGRLKATEQPFVVTSPFSIPSSLVMMFLHAGFQEEADVWEVFHTEFQMRLLWGSRGVERNKDERFAKFDEVLTALSNRLELSAT